MKWIIYINDDVRHFSSLSACQLPYRFTSTYQRSLDELQLKNVKITTKKKNKAEMATISSTIAAREMPR
jgi:hypothetical protein